MSEDLEEYKALSTAAKARAEAASPGDWNACNDGKCPCVTIMAADHPIATCARGDWGDEYPSLRITGDSFDAKAEAYMEKIVYGHIAHEAAEANCRFIAAAKSDVPVLAEAVLNLCAEVDRLLGYLRDCHDEIKQLRDAHIEGRPANPEEASE